MQGGDLDNRLPPRWLVVFEGVIGGHPTPTDRARYDLYVRTRAWKRAVNSFVINQHSAKVLWDLTWRQDYKFDVATFLPEKAEQHVRTWLDRHSVPAVNVMTFDSPAHLGRQLAYMVDVYAVVHAEPSNRFMYGDRGVLVSGSWTI